MTYVALAVALLLFMGIVRVGGIVERSMDVVRTARGSVAIMSSPSLSDDDKEAHARRAATRLIGVFIALALWSAAAVVAPVVLVAAGDIAGLYSVDRAMEIAVSWPFLLVACVAMTGMWIALSR